MAASRPLGVPAPCSRTMKNASLHFLHVFPNVSLSLALCISLLTVDKMIREPRPSLSIGLAHELRRDGRGGRGAPTMGTEERERVERQ